VRRQQRLREAPQRIRAVLLHVIHTRSTNDLALQQPHLTHGLSARQSCPKSTVGDDRATVIALTEPGIAISVAPLN
jgi:hypothetical protein